MCEEHLKKAILSWQKKQYYFEYELSIAANGEKKFELREKRKECQQEIVRLINSKYPQANYRETVDYSPLRKSLAQRQWQEADKETVEIMFKVIGKENQGVLEHHDIITFPCKHIYQIDSLWNNFSNHNFGFGIQKIILNNLGDYSYKNWTKFGSNVGWSIKDTQGEDRDLPWEQLDFSINAPKGHLPWFIFRCLGRMDYSAKLLFERLDSCKQLK